jgi:uncharacterized delta-60 repeat protein
MKDNLDRHISRNKERDGQFAEHVERGYQELKAAVLRKGMAKSVVAFALALSGALHLEGVQPIPGSLDSSFSSGTWLWVNGYPQVNFIAEEANGGILVLGNFTSFNGIPRKGILRLNPNGDLDESFDPESAANGRVINLQPLPNGQLLIMGGFNKYGDAKCGCVARLNSDGSLDPTFVSPLEPAAGNPYDAGVHAIAMQQDGKLIVAGAFYPEPLPTVGSVPAGWVGVARLSTTGNWDATFRAQALNWLAEPFAFTSAIELLADQSILYAGSFHPFQISPGGFGRLSQSGIKDGTVQLPQSTWHTTGILLPQVVNFMTNFLISVGSESLGSDFLVRMNSKGELDQSFQLPPEVTSMRPAIQQDGKILAEWNSGIARLSADGLLDYGFLVTGEDVQSHLGGVLAVALQRDGKALVAKRAGFTTNGGAAFSLIRLHGGEAAAGPPIVYKQPSDKVAVQGDSPVTISAGILSYTTPDFQWSLNGVPIPGQTGAKLVLQNVDFKDAGEYSLKATNPLGSAVSHVATLTVKPTPPLEIVNHSLVQDQMRLTIQTLKNRTHRLLSSPSNRIPKWSALRSFTGDGGLLTLQVPVSVLSSGFFYQVVAD